MKAVGLLVLLFSNQGNWFGGQDGRIDLEWNSPAAAVDSELTWELTLAGARIDGGVVQVKRGEKTMVCVRVPKVRARTIMQWSYRLAASGRDKPLETRSLPIEVFPRDLLDRSAQLMRDKRVVLVRRADELSIALKDAGLEFDEVDDVAALATRAADVVIVAPDALDASPYAQAPLLALAENGASVFLFAQSQPAQIAEIPLARRASAGIMECEWEHPLLRDFSERDVNSLLATGSELLALRMPAKEPALVVVRWPGEPTDALLAAKTIGRGRIVVCQLPLKDFPSDPRAQTMLSNMLQYACARPEPTPAPRDRRAATRKTEPTIQIPSGAR